MFLWGWKRALLRSNSDSAKIMNSLKMKWGLCSHFIPLISFLGKKKLRKPNYIFNPKMVNLFQYKTDLIELKFSMPLHSIIWNKYALNTSLDVVIQQRKATQRIELSHPHPIHVEIWKTPWQSRRAERVSHIPTWQYQ